MLASEMKLMMYLGKHVNVLSLLSVTTVEMDRGISHAVLEFCELGSLKQYLSLYGYISMKEWSTSEPTVSKLMSPLEKILTELVTLLGIK